MSFRTKLQMMKAIVRTKPGKEFLTMQVQEVSAATIKSNEIKVRVFSSRVNPVDMDLMKGFPSLKYKDPQFGGVDGAGEVLQVGKDVKQFKEGDQVFFYRLFSDIGTWAEEITIPATDAALIPQSISVEQSGAIALPLLTAYEGLVSLKPKKGESILIHGAGGGVGFQAVQLAKALGLTVIANASQRDKSDLEKAGIDQFIDYKTTDFSTALQDNSPTYVFDVVGGDTLKKSIQLRPKAVVSTTFPDVAQMHKTGVQLPGFLKFVMKMMSRKFFKLSKKHNVHLIGQVTGANGEHLKQAVELLATNEAYFTRDFRKLPLADIEANGMSKSSVGQVIIFHEGA